MVEPSVSSERVDGFLDSERAAAELEILTCGHEDIHGLWEIAASVNTCMPDQAIAHVLRLAQAVVSDLLDRGLLALKYGHALENKDSPAVAVEQRASVIADVSSWDPWAHGEDDAYYTVEATPAGSEEYYRLERVAGQGGQAANGGAGSGNMHPWRSRH